MSRFIEKASEKLHNLIKNAPPTDENPEESKNNWVVVKQSYISQNQIIDTALVRANLRILPTFNDE